MKYEIKNGGITENGHFLMIEDAIKKLNRIDHLECASKEVPKINLPQFTEVVDVPQSEVSILRTKLWADAFISDMPNQHRKFNDWQNQCGKIADEAVEEFDKRFKI